MKFLINLLLNTKYTDCIIGVRSNHLLLLLVQIAKQSEMIEEASIWGSPLLFYSKRRLVLLIDIKWCVNIPDNIHYVYENFLTFVCAHSKTNTYELGVIYIILFWNQLPHSIKFHKLISRAWYLFRNITSAT